MLAARLGPGVRTQTVEVIAAAAMDGAGRAFAPARLRVEIAVQAEEAGAAGGDTASSPAGARSPSQRPTLLLRLLEIGPAAEVSREIAREMRGPGVRGLGPGSGPGPGADPGRRRGSDGEASGRIMAMELEATAPGSDRPLRARAAGTDPRGPGAAPRVFVRRDAAGDGGSGLAGVVWLPDHVIIPSLVNAHAHLDLTHIGPVPPADDFIAWVDMVRERRSFVPEAIAASVGEGIDRLHAGGVAIVGDIAGVMRLEPWQVLRSDPRVMGVSYIEFFGQGHGQAASIERMRAIVHEAQHEIDRDRRRGADGRGSTAPSASASASPDGDAIDDMPVQLGLQPHAPYSAGREVYQAAVDLAAAGRGLRLSTHLAETLDELQFVDSATGRFRDLIVRLGKWDDSIVGSGRHPVEHLEAVLGAAPWLVAHVNYASPPQIERLARWGTSVAYCPRASAYFGHVEHPYRAMLQAGVNVCLGTDSMLCLDTPGRISVLDDMALLARRDGAPIETLLAMATVNSARGLGVDPRLVTLEPGTLKAGLLALPLSATIAAADDAPPPMESSTAAARLTGAAIEAAPSSAMMWLDDLVRAVLGVASAGSP